MKHKKPRLDLATDTIELAKTIPDAAKREACIASAFAFASKYLKEAERQKLLGGIKVTELANVLTEWANEMIEEEVEKKVKVEVEKKVEEKMLQLAKQLLRRGIAVHAIAEDTGLDVSSIEEVQQELNYAI